MEEVGWVAGSGGGCFVGFEGGVAWLSREEEVLGRFVEESFVSGLFDLVCMLGLQVLFLDDWIVGMLVWGL